MLWEDATYGMLKLDHLPYLYDNLCSKIGEQVATMIQYDTFSLRTETYHESLPIKFTLHFEIRIEILFRA